LSKIDDKELQLIVEKINKSKKITSLNLDLSHNRITDISVLESLTNLKKLNLD
jgi:Leucine-rich repeat (LRR) protein